jgi:hypothetical protein
MAVLASSSHGRVAIGAVLLTFVGCEAPELAVAVEMLPDADVVLGPPLVCTQHLRHTLRGTILAATMLHSGAPQ